MSEYTATPEIIARLRQIPELEDAIITEDYTSPSVCRPVLKPVISVGVKEMAMKPVARYRHTIYTVTRITAIFPCGLGETDIADTVYRIGAALIGRVFFTLYVESIEVKDTQFNSQLYGVKAELNVNMRSTQNGFDTIDTAAREGYAVGSVTLDRMPDRVTVSRKRTADGMETSGREITLEGSSEYSPTGSIYGALHSLMNSDSPFKLILPRGNGEIEVLPTLIETENDESGFGFSYKLIFSEVLQVN